jgi:hypothetical protein
MYAVPNPHFPPDPAVLNRVAAVVDEITAPPAALGLSRG